MLSAAVSDAARAPVSGPSAQRYGFAASVSPAGYWVTEDRAWTIQIIPCASGFCGRIVGLGASPRADVLRRDIRNPVVSKRSAPLCELPVLGGFTPSQKEAGVWEGGWIYDPEHGEIYKSNMTLEGANTLKLRGYVLIPLFGRDETLTRVSGPARHCSNMPGVATGTAPTPTG
jgi:uncharacterized protein (DUF2147 family)